jgi:hypothetical protein
MELKSIYLITGCTLSGAYVLVNAFSQRLNKLSKKNSEIIKSSEHLERIIQEERTNLDIPKETQIEQVYFDPSEPSKIHKKETNFYEVYFNPINLTRDDIRHEFFHLKDGHIDKIFSKTKWLNKTLSDFYYTYYAEPKTALYCWNNRKNNSSSKTL